MRELIGKNGYIFVVAIIFVTVSLFSTTYSLFIDTNDTNEFTYKTGLLDLEITKGDTIHMDDAFPTSDTKGMKSDAYSLTIKNIGTLAYMFDIKMLSDEIGNVIDDDYIRVMVDDDKPISLGKNDNILKKNILLYPQEEITFNIRIWLDIDTPNDQLGKSFNANIMTNGIAFYKTLDNSGANHPITIEDMIPVYYDSDISHWRIADSSNLDSNYEWYNYDKQKWANVVKINNSEKYIYDISNHGHNILVNKDLEVSSSMLSLDNSAFAINTLLNDTGSIITRFRFNEINNDNIIFAFNSGNLKYNDNKFILNINGNDYESDNYEMITNKFYILSYTVSNDKIIIYVNGDKVLDIDNLSSSYSIINYGISSNITISDIYVYDKMLDKNTISSNFKNNIIILEDNLVLGYNDFYPMTLYNYYHNSDYGTVVDDNDISEFLVWIPRFKYRVWNVLGNENFASYDAYNHGIDISFENFNHTSGTIYCKNNLCYSDKEYTTLVDDGDNNKYYTHMAFTNLDKELYGFWVGKYEISSSCHLSSCLTNRLDFRVVPNANIWNNNYLSNFYTAIINKNNNYHLIKNLEWGAISYLSHSEYGVCLNHECKYDIDSTTNNIYGVYNMNGNYSEFVMANYTTVDNDLSLSNTHFGEIPIVNSDYNLYYKDSFLLGDATRELSLNNSINGIWYNNHSIFVDPINNWFIRGSNIMDNNQNGIFYYGASSDDASEYITTRVVVR